MFELSDNFWRRLNLIIGFFVLLCTFFLLVFMAHLEIKDLDLWLHIGMGRYIVEHNFRVPAVDILSCTVAGTPWVNHEWLFQVFVYTIFHNWGAAGLITMQVWLVAITLLILAFLGYNRKNLLLIVLSLFLVSMVYQSRFTIRPDLYSLFFFSLYVMFVGFFINKRWVAAALFITQVFWANMHGFFFLGPLIIAFGLAGEWIKRSVLLPWDWNKTGRLTDKEYRRMKLILGLVILACFITPSGVHGAIYPINVFKHISGDSKIFFTKIIELQRPIDNVQDLFSREWPEYKLLMLISFLSFVFNRRKLDVGVFFFWIFFLIFSLVAIRNLVFFAFAAYLAIVINISTIKFKNVVPIRFTHKRFLYITSIFAQVLLVFWILRSYDDVKNNGYFDFDKYERKSEFGGVSQHQFPIKATQFLVENKVRGNFFNDFNSGSYLVGNCFPNIKVFIDGRTEVYGPNFFQYYREISEFDNVDKLKAAIRRFQITGIFLNAVQNPIPGSISNYLYKDPDWALVYFDFDAAIFLRNIPLNHDVIIRNRIDLTKWKAKEMDLFRLGAKRVLATPNFNRSFTLMNFGFYDAAVAEANAALEVNPTHAGPYKILGKIAGKKKDFQTSYHYFRLACVLAPNDQNARLNMALALSDLNKYDEAAIQYENILELWPSSVEAYFKFAKVNIARKKYADAFNLIQRGYELNPAASEDVLGLGDLLRDNKVFDLACRSYELLLNKQPALESPYLRICQIYDKTGHQDKCIALLKKGLQRNPESKVLKERLRFLGVPANRK